MRFAVGFIAALSILLVVLTQQATATFVGGEPLVCPACGHKFSSATVEASTTSGGDEEGRPVCEGMDTQEFRLHDCPRCHYSGFLYEFNEGGAPVGPVLQKVRDALAKNSAMLPAGALWPLERVKATEIAYRAADASAIRFEQLYRLGAWLADDAGEDALALDYREKAAEQLVLAADLNGRPGADYAAAIAAYWRGDFAKAGPLFKSASAGVDAKKIATEKQWKPLRDGILRRIDAKNADPKAPPDTQPSYDKLNDDELDWNSILEEATPGELPLVRQRLAMKRMTRNIESLQRIAELGVLGQAAAYEKADAGGFKLRRDFVFAFGRRPDAKACEQIGNVIRFSQPHAAEFSEFQARSLGTLWEQLCPDAAALEPTGLAPDVAKLIRDLKASDVEFNRDAQDAIASLTEAGSPAAAAGLLAELASHASSYAEYPLVPRTAPIPWKTMAMDSPNAIELTKRMLAAPKPGEADLAVRLSLRPLAYCRDAGSLDVLKSALTHRDGDVRLEAASCLIVRGNHEGVAAMITLATANDDILPKLEPEIAAIFASLITPDDIPALLKLRDKWPGPIERKNDDTKAMAAVTVRAALARADGKQFMADYDKAVDELLGSGVTGHEPARLPWEDTVPQNMKLLSWCGNIYYSPHVDKLLGPMLRTGISDYGVATTIEMLTRNGTEDEDDVLAEQFNRPVPMMVKQSLIEATGRLHVKGQQAVLARWAKSAHPGLAIAAREALKQERWSH